MRLVVMVSGAAAVALGITGGHAAPQAVGQILLLIAGSVGAVAGGVVFGAGAPSHALRRAAAPLWVHGVGRATACALVTAILTLGVAMAAGGFSMSGGRAVAVSAVLFGGAVGGLSAALGPRIGASGAGAIALGTVWVGFVPPAAMGAILEPWPAVANAVFWLWHLAPVAWRAELVHEDVGHGIVLALWAIGGFGSATVRAFAAERGGR
jgi:hypothetical protein